MNLQLVRSSPPDGLAFDPAPAFVVALGRRLSIVAYDPVDAGPAEGPPTPRMAGAATPHPIVALELSRRDGAVRRLCVLAVSAHRLAEAGLQLFRGGRVEAEVDPECLEPAQRAFDELVDMLGAGGRAHLLRLLTESVAPLFGAGADPDFAAAAAKLLDVVDPKPVPARRVFPIGDCVALELEPRIAAALGSDPIFALTAPGRVGAVREAALSPGDGKGRVLFLPRTPSSGATLLAFAADGELLRIEVSKAERGSFADWLDAACDAERAWGVERLKSAAQTDARAAGLLDELSLDPDDEARLDLDGAWRSDEGVLLVGRLRDRRRLVRAVRVVRAGEVVDRAIESLVGAPEGETRFGAEEALCGWFPAPAGLGCVDEARIALVFRSGRARTIRAGRLAPFAGPTALATFSPGPGEEPEAARRRLAAALAEAAAGSVTLAPERRRIEIGPWVSGRPFAILAQATAGLDMLRLRAAALAADPEAQGFLQIVYWATDAADAVRIETLRDCAAVYGVSSVALIFASEASPAAQLRGALRETPAAALVLGPATTPTSSGWAEFCVEAATASTPFAAVAGVLRSCHGALRAAGARAPGPDAEAPGALRNAPSEGFARVDLPGPGAALLSAEAVATAAEVETPYHGADYLIAEAVLRLRAGGRSSFVTNDLAFIDFDPRRPAQADVAAATDAALLAMATCGGDAA